jgi:hypothetical protein
MIHIFYIYTFLYCLICVRLIDFILKLILQKNTTYFLLHAIFNLWVTWIVFEEVVFIFLNPLNIYLVGNFSINGIISTLGIMAFHTHHLLFYSNLTLEDWIHHMISSIILPITALILPYSSILCLSNAAMCGIPGGIDYFMLFLVKLQIIDKMTEKKINRLLNLLIRWPIMFLCFYIFIINVYHNMVKSEYITIMIVAFVLHMFNAAYYCDKVIGNYYIKALK